jgi:endonuclease III
MVDKRLERALLSIRPYSEELGLDLRKPADRFAWLVASVHFAKRISAGIAKRTFLLLKEEGLTEPREMIGAGWNRLVEVLDSGGYVRYDFSTASTLLKLAETVKSTENLERIAGTARSPRELERRLMELPGVGPVATSIFLRELRGIWSNADPEPSPLALEVARRLRVRDVKRFEPALVRLGIEFCKRKRCQTCPVRELCRFTRKRGGP